MNCILHQKYPEYIVATDISDITTDYFSYLQTGKIFIECNKDEFFIRVSEWKYKVFFDDNGMVRSMLPNNNWECLHTLFPDNARTVYTDTTGEMSMEYHEANSLSEYEFKWECNTSDMDDTL